MGSWGVGVEGLVFRDCRDFKDYSYGWVELV